MRTRAQQRWGSAVACAGALLACDSVVALDDQFVQCRAVDPEIRDDLMAYQLGDRLLAQRLVAAPNPAGPFLRGVSLRIDQGLPSVGLTANGPEIGLDSALGYVLVYTKQDAQQRWRVARAAYACEPPSSNACFVRANWQLRSFPNLATLDNRWRPFASADGSHAAWVTYLWGLDAQPPPYPEPAIVRLAWRPLEDANDQEILAPDEQVQNHGLWAEIDGDSWIATTLGTAGSATQIALVDPDATPPAITAITSSPGMRSQPAIWLDSASGSYVLAYLWWSGPLATSNEMRLHRRDESTGEWPADPFLAFTASDAEGDPTTPRQWMLSVEPFVDGAGNSYVAFSTGDAQAFNSVTDGNIWYVHFDATGATPPEFARVNDTTQVTKRIEPEVHYPSNDGPAVYYTQIATAGDPQCLPNDPMIRRARTGLPAARRSVDRRSGSASR